MESTHQEGIFNLFQRQGFFIKSFISLLIICSIAGGAVAIYSYNNFILTGEEGDKKIIIKNNDDNNKSAPGDVDNSKESSAGTFLKKDKEDNWFLISKNSLDLDES